MAFCHDSFLSCWIFPGVFFLSVWHFFGWFIVRLFFYNRLFFLVGFLYDDFFSGWLYVQKVFRPACYLSGDENPGGFFSGGFWRVASIRDPRVCYIAFVASILDINVFEWVHTL